MSQQCCPKDHGSMASFVRKARIRQIQIHCAIIVVIVVIMDGYIPPSGL